MKRMLIVQLLAAAVLADMLIIAWHHFVPGPPPVYAFLLGLPAALLGAFWALGLLAVSAAWAVLRWRALLPPFLVLLGVAAISGGYTIWSQARLGFFCPYAYGGAALWLATSTMGVVAWRREAAA